VGSGWHRGNLSAPGTLPRSRDLRGHRQGSSMARCGRCARCETTCSWR
jgi:hypothetical protein